MMHAEITSTNLYSVASNK